MTVECLQLHRSHEGSWIAEYKGAKLSLPQDVSEQTIARSSARVVNGRIILESLRDGREIQPIHLSNGGLLWRLPVRVDEIRKDMIEGCSELPNSSFDSRDSLRGAQRLGAVQGLGPDPVAQRMFRYEDPKPVPREERKPSKSDSRPVLDRCKGSEEFRSFISDFQEGFDSKQGTNH